MARGRLRIEKAGPSRPGRRLAVLPVAALVAIAMVACGGDDKEDTEGASGQSATTAAAVTTVAPAATTTTAAKATVATTSNPALGTILVDSAGKTLYVFDRDTGGTSSCTGNCAVTWPALVLPSGTTTPVAGSGVSGLGAVARPDDATKMQVTLGGKPLYNFSGDAAPGDTKGDGVGGTWHVAKPS